MLSDGEAQTVSPQHQPVEKSQALHDHPDASFSGLFEILGLKNSEDPLTAKYKARIVVQGSNVKDGWGEHVYFADTSSAPTNMAAIRSVHAFGEITGGASTADAEAAYVQPLLPDDVHLYVGIPSSLQTAEMKQAIIGMICPVFRLRRPLYGWSRSGNIWEKNI